MKPKYCFLAASVAIALILITHLGIAYPLFRVGAIALGVVVVAGVTVFGLISAISERREHHGYMTSYEWLMACSDGIAGLIAVIVCIFLGAIVGG